MDFSIDEPRLEEERDGAEETPRPAKQRKAIRSARATKACDICRRQKTRCFPSQVSAACLRCVTLGNNCSFLEEQQSIEPFKESALEQIRVGSHVAGGAQQKEPLEKRLVVSAV